MPSASLASRFLSTRARRSRFAAFVAAGLLAVFAPKLYGQMRIAVVDMQRALVETEQGRRAKNQLKTLFQQRQVELDQRQNALKLLRDDLERQRTTLPREEMAHRMEDYQTQFVALQQNFLEYQQELAQREAELTKQIYVNLQGVIRQLGTQENFTVIFEQSGIVWSPQHLDLTDRVVQAYNQSHPAGREEPLAPRGDAGVPARPAARDAGPARPVVNPHPRDERGGGGGGGGGGGDPQQ